MSYTYSFPKLNRAGYPDWQAFTKVAMRLAQLRGHPLELVLSQDNPYPNDFPEATSDPSPTETHITFAQELTTAEESALRTLWGDGSTMCLPTFPGYGPVNGKTGTRITDIYPSMANFIVTQAGLPSNSCIILVDRSNPDMPEDEYDLILFHFNIVLSVQQRKAVQDAFPTLFTWVLP